MDPTQIITKTHIDGLRRRGLAWSALPDAPVLPSSPSRRVRLPRLRRISRESWTPTVRVGAAASQC